MTDSNDKALDDLVSRLTPVKVLRLYPIWVGAAVGLVIGAIYVYFAYGPRPEWEALLRHGVIIDHPIAFLKPALFLAIGTSALIAVGDLARPQGRFSWSTALPIFLCVAAVLVALVSEVANDGLSKTLDQLHLPMVVCFLTIFLGGMLGWSVLWWTWLRRAASASPVALGAVSGLATASFMAAAYAVHCPLDAPVYILLMYGLPVVVGTGVGALLGKRLLSW